MLLSDVTSHIETLISSGEPSPEGLYGIVVDTYTPDVCRSLKEIGFLADSDAEAPSQLSFSVMDAILSYANHGIECILEVPAEEDSLDPKMLVAVAMNCDASISLLTPKNDSDEAWRLYSEKVKAYAECWLEQPNARKQLLPFSGFVAYKIQSVFGHRRENMTDDAYMKYRFVDGIKQERIDAVKEELEPVIVSYFGGEKELESFAHTLAHAIGKTLSERADTVGKELQADTSKEGQTSE